MLIEEDMIAARIADKPAHVQGLARCHDPEEIGVALEERHRLLRSAVVLGPRCLHVEAREAESSVAETHDDGRLRISAQSCHRRALLVRNPGLWLLRMRATARECERNSDTDDHLPHLRTLR